jgi:hypothetical protein
MRIRRLKPPSGWPAAPTPGCTQPIAERLGNPTVGALWLQTAGELADSRLLPVLLRLRAPDNQPDDPRVQHLEHAISYCSTPRNSGSSR